MSHSIPSSRTFLFLSVVLPWWFSFCYAQISTAACLAQYQWMSNSRNQDPCVVAAYLQAQCTPNETFTVIGLHGDGPYNPPLNAANICCCNPVVYSLLSACSVCQGGNTNSWSEWTESCPSNATAQNGYPEAVPFQIIIPRWAETLPSETGGTFNVTYAKAVSAKQVPPPEHKKLSVRTIIAIVLSILGAILLIVGGFTVYQFKKPRTVASAKARPPQDDEEQFKSLRSAKSLESRHSGFSDTGGYRYSRVGLTTDHEERSSREYDRPRSFSHPTIAEQPYDPPASPSSHTGDHGESHPRTALPPHSFTYPPPTASPTSASSSFYRYDPFNPPEQDDLSSGSHPPPTSSPYSPGKPLRELSFPPPRKALSPFPYEPYSPSSPRSRLLSPTSPHWPGHSRRGSSGHHEP